MYAVRVSSSGITYQFWWKLVQWLKNLKGAHTIHSMLNSTREQIPEFVLTHVTLQKCLIRIAFHKWCWRRYIQTPGVWVDISSMTRACCILLVTIPNIGPNCFNPVLTAWWMLFPFVAPRTDIACSDCGSPI